ncbi:MAG: type II toxin-antitoxin system Phd/YefM family antitoxin [Chloroflexi bacterium]|nr:type II toxin-antitoxin system Phd/YefM family antitoxin [Chloroflexota bacterium]
MRTLRALDVRKRFGQVLDEAAAGERIVIERAGHAVAALVSLEDLAELDPRRERERRLRAVADLKRLVARSPERTIDAAGLVRASRAARTKQVMQAAGDRGSSPRR